MSGVPQSILIFGVLIFLFVVFITSKGQLSKYLGVLGLGTSSGSSSTSGLKLNTTPQTVTPLGGTLAGVLPVGGLSVQNLSTIPANTFAGF